MGVQLLLITVALTCLWLTTASVSLIRANSATSKLIATIFIVIDVAIIIYLFKDLS